MEKNLQLDEEKIKEYFPVSTVVPASEPAFFAYHQAPR